MFQNEAKCKDSSILTRYDSRVFAGYGNKISRVKIVGLNVFFEAKSKQRYFFFHFKQ